jgi:hypothetical protein
MYVCMYVDMELGGVYIDIIYVQLTRCWNDPRLQT